MGRRSPREKQWWTKRRPEIVEDFEREVIGRVPKNVPKVTWTRHRLGRVGGGRARRQGPATGRARGQLGVSRHQRGHPDDGRDAGRRERARAADDHVSLGQRVARRRARRRSAGQGRLHVPASAAGQRSAGHRSVDRGWMGLRAAQPDERAGRQRRRAHEGHHRPGEQGPAAQARRLGRAARLGVGRVARARLPGDRCDRGRQARRHRGRLALRQGRARHDGLRQPLRRRAGRIVRRGRRQAAPPQFRRGGREPDRQRRIPLDGRQLPEVRRRRNRRSAARTPATFPSMRTS